MAPKRKVVDPVSDAEGSGAEDKKAPKKAKGKGPVVPLDPSLPINTAFPAELSFPAKPAGTIRIAAWNICGIQASQKKGFSKYVEAEDSDILVLTETKTSDPGFPVLSEKYPHRYFGVDPKKGYAGTAILSKLEPQSVVFGLPTTAEPLSATAGRIVTLEFENTYVVGTYVPNAGNGLVNLDKKEAWNVAFEKYLRELDAKKAVIWTGDLNVVPTDKDIRNWSTNYNKSAGCTDQEISGFNSQLNPSSESGHKKLIDVWRHLNPDKVGYYTYFSYRFQCRVKGIGWRLDYFVVSERILEKIKTCEIRLEVYGASDHVPLMLEFEGSL
ncbi:exodeoxyribonuclease III [Pseudohyphozyma bogoriensis]|nr:exodeoxyribonuclease III [Pseudohyphozyma bogoriensis]